MKKNKKFLSCIEQTCDCPAHEEAGDPIVIPLTRPSDLKSRVLNLVGSQDLSGLLQDEDEEEQKAFELLANEDTNEVDDFNSAMALSPYSVNNEGMAKYEIELTQNKEEVAALRQFMSLKDNPDFLDLMSQFSDLDNLSDILQKVKELGGSGGISQPVDEPEPSE